MHPPAGSGKDSLEHWQGGPGVRLGQDSLGHEWEEREERLLVDSSGGPQEHVQQGQREDQLGDRQVGSQAEPQGYW